MFKTLYLLLVRFSITAPLVAVNKWVWSWAMNNPGILHLTHTDPSAQQIAAVITSLVSLAIFGLIVRPIEVVDDAESTKLAKNIEWPLILGLIFVSAFLTISQVWILALLTVLTTFLVHVGYKIRARILNRRTEREEGEKRAQENAQEEMRKREVELVRHITSLIGDERETKALLAAIERLTPYAKEEAEHILTALRNDAERYVMLRSFERTSKNEVLAKASGVEADEIAATAQALCADAAEMALELLREYQSVEAESRLGISGQRGSELARAHKDFKKFMDGLREVSQDLGPGAEESLRQEIDALKPGNVVRELPTEGKGIFRRLGSGN